MIRMAMNRIEELEDLGEIEETKMNAEGRSRVHSSLDGDGDVVEGTCNIHE